MFGSIGFPELVLIFVVALLLFGPRKLPEIGRSVGKAMGEFRRASNDLQRTLEEEVALDDVRKVRDEVAATVADVAAAVTLEPAATPPRAEANAAGSAQATPFAPSQPTNPGMPGAGKPGAGESDVVSNGDSVPAAARPDAESLPEAPEPAEPR